MTKKIIKSKYQFQTAYYSYTNHKERETLLNIIKNVANASIDMQETHCMKGKQEKKNESSNLI